MTVALPSILTSPVVLALLAFAASMIALAYAAQPMRLHMVQLGESMLRERRWNKDQREEINFLLDTMDSGWVAVVLPIAILLATICSLLGIEPPKNKALEVLSKDERFFALNWRYFVSLLAANPLVALVTIPLGIIGALKPPSVSQWAFRMMTTRHVLAPPLVLPRLALMMLAGRVKEQGLLLRLLMLLLILLRLLMLLAPY